MFSWKTSLGGLLVAIGTPLSQATDETMKYIGIIVMSLGALILGLAAKDHNVTGGTKEQ